MLATSGSVAPEPGGSGDTARPFRAAPGHNIRRVLMTADAVGGVWQYSLDLATALRERGIATTLALMGPSMNGSQRREAVRRGIHFVEAPYQLEWAQSPWEDVERAGDWLLGVASTLHPDIVHLNGYCHAVLPWKAPAIVVAHSCVRSWWRAVHGVAAPAEWDRYTGAVMEGLRAAHLVVAPSLAMIAMLHDEYGAFGPWTVIPNGRAVVDHMADSIPFKSDVVFAAGRLWDKAKNIGALSSIAHELSWRVVIAGAGGADGLDAPAANVTRLGLLDPSTIARWYARASIYVLPAWYEPFGLSVLEAAASGCALVLGDLPSLRENWSDAAVFVNPGDRRELAVAIQRLIENPTERRRLALRAMARARQFTVSRMADAYLEAYQRVPSHAAVV